MSDRLRYATLDALRFVAALVVVLFHISSQIAGAPNLARHGYLAVDFFLMLSGFVVALSYRGKLAAGLSIAGFLNRRAIRLYPLALCGAALGAVGMILRKLAGNHLTEPMGGLVGISLCNLFLVPNLAWVQFNGILFPGNVPLWSLLGEFAINVGWALLVLLPFDKAVRIALVALSGIALCLVIPEAGNADLGWRMQTLDGGVARMVFSFFLGTLMVGMPGFRAGRMLAHPVFLGMALVAILCVPGLGWAWDLAAIFLLLPTVLLCGIGAGTVRGASFRTILGDVSYPLYAVHFPILAMLGSAASRLFPAVPPILVGLAGLLLSVSAAIALQFFYDMPVRRYLTRWALRRSEPTQAA